MIKRGVFFGALLLAGGCVSPFAALQRFNDNGAVLAEIRTEIADLKHSIHASEIELRLLEDKLENQTIAKTGYLEEELTILEKKIHLLEKTQDKVSVALKHTSSYAQQIQDLDRKVGDMEQLKGALASISKYIETKKPSVYRVQEGDSLSKIATTYGTSVETLKIINSLEGDKIRVDQILQLPDPRATQ